jgi:hypothetical protein
VRKHISRAALTDISRRRSRTASTRGRGNIPRRGGGTRHLTSQRRPPNCPVFSRGVKRRKGRPRGVAHLANRYEHLKDKSCFVDSYIRSLACPACLAVIPATCGKPLTVNQSGNSRQWKEQHSRRRLGFLDAISAEDVFEQSGLGRVCCLLIEVQTHRPG